jgi:hypothetical protein
MRKLLIATVLGLSLLSVAGPTLATDQATAIELCAKNPSCGLAATPGGVNFWVVGPGRRLNEIHCPDKGECVCVLCNHPPSRQASDIGHIIRPQMNAPQSLSDPGPAGPAATAPVPQYPTDGPALP